VQRATKPQGSSAEVLLLETPLPEPALPKQDSAPARHAGFGQGHWESKASRRNASAFSWRDAGTSRPSRRVPLGPCVGGRQPGGAHLGVLEDVHDEYGQTQPEDVGHEAGVEIRVRVLL